MKKFFFILTAICALSSILTYAQRSNNSFAEVNLSQRKKKSTRKTSPSPVAYFSQQSIPTYIINIAYIDFNETLPTVTIFLINESTGKTIYSEVCNAPTSISISLDKESCDNYSIQIESDEAFLYGSFTL